MPYNDQNISIKHSKLVVLEQNSALNSRIWSNFTKFEVEFIQIRSKWSNSTKFSIQICGLNFEIRPSLESASLIEAKQ